MEFVLPGWYFRSQSETSSRGGLSAQTSHSLEPLLAEALALSRTPMSRRLASESSVFSKGAPVHSAGDNGSLWPWPRGFSPNPVFSCSTRRGQCLMLRSVYGSLPFFGLTRKGQSAW